MKIAIKLLEDEIERKNIFLKVENDIVYIRELQKDIDILTDAVKKLTIPVVVGQSEQLTCKHCGFWKSKHIQGKYCPDRNNSEFKSS